MDTVYSVIIERLIKLLLYLKNVTGIFISSHFIIGPRYKSDTRLRTATIDFSPLLPSGNPVNFIIDVTGPRGVNVK